MVPMVRLHKWGIISHSLVEDLHKCTHSNKVPDMLKWEAIALTLPHNKGMVINRPRPMLAMVAIKLVQIQQLTVVRVMGYLNQCQLSQGMISRP